MKVLVCMSGGVDSSVAAALLAREGHEVAGLFLRGAGGTAAGPVAPLERARRARGCCSVEDAADARRVADRLGVPFYAADFSADFEGLVDDFVAEYLRGRTPNPCIRCNRDLKFGRALEYARALGCDRVATGHYAVGAPRGGRAGLRAAADPAKDQSYVLFPLSQAALGEALFPLGGRTKEEVRGLARDLGLAVADKPESQDICFVPGGDYRALLRERTGGAGNPGAVVDRAGTVLGTHDGTARFTVGQRRGLPVAARGAPRYVTGIDAATGVVEVGERDDLDVRSFVVGGWNAVSAPRPGAGEVLAGRVRVRHRHEPQPARVTGVGDGRVRVDADEPVRAPAPGQAAVLYDEDGWVLGGGWIESVTERTSDRDPA